MAVRPGRVLARRRARRVEEALLGEQHERPLRDRARATAPRSDAAISSSVPPRWTVAGRRALRRPPGDRPVERPVDLEHARPVAVALEPAPVARPAAGRRRARSSWRGVDVEQDGSRRRQLVERLDAARRSRSRRRASAGTTASASAMRCEPPRGERPADGVRRAAPAQPERRRSAAARAAASSGRRAREQRRAPVRRGSQPRRAASPAAPRASAEARQRERVARQRAAAPSSVLEQRLGIARRAARSAAGRRPPSAPEPARGRVRASARARPPCRRRTGARARAGGWIHSSPCSASGSVRKNGERDRRAGGSPSRRRGRSPAASARPSARRRPTVSARLEHAHRAARPAPARSPRPARSARSRRRRRVRHGRSLALRPSTGRRRFRRLPT